MKYDFECNHCKAEIDIQEHELYELYADDRHEVKCPYCKETIHILSVPTYDFTVTDEYGDEIIDED